MLDPSKKFKDSLQKAHENLDEITFNDDIYPCELMQGYRCRHEVPKCIFIPATKVIRQIMHALLKKNQKTTDTEFLQQLGLLENPNLFMKKDVLLEEI